MSEHRQFGFGPGLDFLYFLSAGISRLRPLLAEDDDLLEGFVFFIGKAKAEQVVEVLAKMTGDVAVNPGLGDDVDEDAAGHKGGSGFNQEGALQALAGCGSSPKPENGWVLNARLALKDTVLPCSIISNARYDKSRALSWQ
jgi:hypothetical protein